MFARRRSAIILTAAILLLVLLCAFAPCDIAEAILPVNYQTNVSNRDYDWWYDALEMDTLKHTVDSWRNSTLFDFDYLERNPIVIAVIDTGFTLSHEIFVGKYNEHGTPISTEGRGEYDVLYRNSSGNVICKNTAKTKLPSGVTYDETNMADESGNSHGTHVAGTVAILIHELNLEKYIKIMPIRASNSDNFYTSDVKSAADFALANGANVVNLSLASNGGTFSFATETMAEKAVFVAAAGNEGKDSDDTAYYPASNKYTIGVMNYQKDMASGYTLSASSNYGACYDICAPGTNIYSAKGTTVNQYKSLSGTSMASPVVAFAAALAMAKDRALAGQNGVTKTPIEITQMVREAYTFDLPQKGNYPLHMFSINALVGGEMSYNAKIVFENDALGTQKINNLLDITLNLTTVPVLAAGKGEVSWYLDDEKVGEGFDFVLTPPSEAGTYSLKAIWSPPDEVDDVETLAEIHVEYMNVTAATAKSLSVSTKCNGEMVTAIDNLETGNVYEFSIDKENWIDPETLNGAVWYVNDVATHIGKSYLFNADKIGDYKIKVKVGNAYLDTVEFKVAKISQKTRNTYWIFTFVAVGAILLSVLAIVITLVTLYRRGKRR